ncbi:TIGR04024 family LLM class F420-dependent oxidoreductase [Natrialbaceae archaeon AArc-T1-2]|uniref:TIGR04024 family LLM class F420-dependent oxidoreductase n=1 Tax=Natrialbaceae archaeon AArc-T1-2 TaxID=3053904 RepID=UPI00255AFF15|nr:TIGR04024 family LLM class F420-dependent oxidoreductase [Natrialbaceae archaeon AArc-T1-2]WIV65718.1 TIGR04024 family LLM class F420-dependent oxidoreductase [Natrialbaceae archaeon AArc-T1-2]
MSADINRDVVLPLDEYDNIEEAVSLAQRAETMGYGAVSVGETAGRNVPLVLSVVAERTDEIGIADDVISPYSRSPAAIGQTAVTLQEISDGRFRLRIGASSPALAERWHGLEFDRPLRRVREAVEIVRQVQSGQRLEYDGEIFSPDGLTLECEPPEPPAPVDVAALGPKATELAGRFGDGWVPQLLPYEQLQARLGDLKRGAELGDRQLDDLRVAPLLRCCALEDGERAREYARSQLAFMIAVYGPFYRQAIADAGWTELTERVRDRWHESGREAAAAAITDDLLEAVVAAGTPAEVRDQVERFEAIDGVDAIQVAFCGGMSDDERDRTLEALAPSR